MAPPGAITRETTMLVRRVLTIIALTSLALTGLAVSSASTSAPPGAAARVGFGSWDPLTAITSPTSLRPPQPELLTVSTTSCG